MKKIRLLTRAFAAFELKLEIVTSSEDHLKKLKYEYGELLKGLNPNVIETDFNTDYAGKYKDQRAYLYLYFDLLGQYLFKNQSQNRGKTCFYTVTSEHPKLYMNKNNFG